MDNDLGTKTPTEQDAQVARDVAHSIVRANCREAALLASDELIVKSESGLLRAIATALATSYANGVKEGAEAERKKEFICTKCGIRKDGEVSDQPEF